MATKQQETSPGTMISDRRLIEETLPLRAISQESLREKAIRHGHISTLHIWWARRPLAACRAAVFGSLIRDKGAGEERNRLQDFIASLCTWEAPNNSNLLDEARRRVLEDNGNVRPKLLDCFAGGGAIPLEGLRLGCETYASELNPVAVLLLLSTLVYPMRYGKPATVESEQSGLMASGKKTVSNKLVHDFKYWAYWVLKSVRTEIDTFYPEPGRGMTPLAYLWARTLKCPNPKCGATVPLLRHLWLARRSGRKIALRMITDTKSKKVSFEIAEGKMSGFDPDKGTIRLGSMECPVCKEGTLDKFDIKSTARQSGFGLQPLAIVVTDNNGNRGYRPFSKLSLEAFSKATQRLRQLESSWNEKLSLVPNEPISTDYDWVLKPPMFGLTRWGDIFNDRQKLALTTFLVKIKDAYKMMLHDGYDPEYAKAVATYLALCLDRLADYNSTACVWAVSGEFIAHTFGRQAIAIAWDYVEVNRFSEATGDWKSAVGWICRVLEHCSALYPQTAIISQASATKLPYSDSYFDVILTDPPYYDAVPYSDLSDFFYVWLKRSIGDLYPDLFATPLAPKSEELVEQSGRVTSASKRHKDKDFYEGGMTKAFQEAHRVLRHDDLRHCICSQIDICLGKANLRYPWCRVSCHGLVADSH
jgi:putative DNA methylase